MLMTHIPQMLLSDRTGWDEIDRSHHSSRWFLRSLVMPMSLLPPVMYAYAELMHPGQVFPLQVPALTMAQLAVVGVVFYGVQVAMVAYMAMLIQRMAQARGHAAAYDGAYALAAIAPVPLWLSSLSLFVPSTAFAMAAVVLAWFASVALIRHGVRPLLHIADDRVAHYVANVVTLAGVAAWTGLLVVTGVVLSILLGWHAF